jgi:acetyl-CoA carboxylase biotin carboxylase subunit
MTAQAEAEASFGNPDVYIEKYIDEPRHIEFQIIADDYGRIVHLGERDCSIQRRHQKLLEESPSPALDSKLRKKIGEMVIRGAKVTNYRNVGTMEFLLDKHGEFYFMEMNTRIQVEHPVTEMVTGIDIIKEQIKIAAGEKLSFQQDDIKFSGHAVECRINAEDPENNFIPSPGKIEILNIPGGPHIRVDTHIYPNCVISPYYDSLLAKLIAYGKDRKEAINAMKRALDEFIIEPIKTTITFHQQILDNQAFKDGRFSTHFVENLFKEKEQIIEE